MSNRKPKTDQKLKRAVSFAAEGEAVEMDKIKTRKNQEKKEPIRRRPSFYDEPSKVASFKRSASQIQVDCEEEGDHVCW